MITLKLDAILKERKISQRGLARETGLRPAVINDLANNKKGYLYLYHLDAIARALNVHVCDLIEYDPTTPHERPAADIDRSEKFVGNKNALGSEESDA